MWDCKIKFGPKISNIKKMLRNKEQKRFMLIENIYFLGTFHTVEPEPAKENKVWTGHRVKTDAFWQSLMEIKWKCGNKCKQMTAWTCGYLLIYRCGSQCHHARTLKDKEEVTTPAWWCCLTFKALNNQLLEPQGCSDGRTDPAGLTPTRLSP